MIYTIFLDLEPYLAQWFTNEQGGTTPIELTKGSAESHIVELFIAKRPKELPPQLRPEQGQVEIKIPSLRFKDPSTYNYLPKHAASALHTTIRERFYMELYTDVLKTCSVMKRCPQILLKDMINAWMEEHHITNDDTNFNSLLKIVQRMKGRYNAAKYYNNKKK